MEIIAIVILIIIVIQIEKALYKERILPQIGYDCHFSKEEVFEGDSLEIIETIMNPSKLMVPGVKAEITTSKYIEFANEDFMTNDKNHSIASVFAVRAKKRITRRWKVKCRKRGFFKIEDTSLVGDDLFGTYHYSTVKPNKSELIVLPKPINVEEYITKTNVAQGDHIVKRYILEDPFMIAGTREYAYGDPMNKIHWGITASQGRLMVRNNETTTKRSITVLLNMQVYENQLKEPPKDSRLELAIKVAAGLLDQSIKSSTPIRLIANGYVDEEQNELDSSEMWGQAHVHHLMILLARLKEIYAEPIWQFISHIKETITTTELIIVTCYIDLAILQLIREKEEAGIVVKVYLMAYEADCLRYEGIEVYYMLDYLKEVGETYADQEWAGL